ncbi:MAG: 2-oxoacid:acceptor oxidoreductase family protein [Caldisericia bacterium]|jgi:2-oxoglutarate ferredoxin oxidoreductase subunit gamma|nr:2-oxoacid:acceptor oxidoreductase family protein [Caldisericia bacterium]MDD3427376.1 2-oxoacid:acceptor oxidoreductase family protein [Caldisericia bacterium]MDD5688877.1 2-oxoacid:acceptor oxidoreductase family protein [Caldisericia bacterium]HOJ15714.1 2-oxoacid:acceptor oxidoreductase family protein [Caldisericia bacterium]HOW02571.1 2-oxoacid:acceptor oxidoreductase family protein [Caldisericia bacterium]
MKVEIIFSGSGGQGLVLASRILAKAAVLESMNVLQSQVYGAEARGGATKSEVIISDRQIFFPRVLVPDILIAITEEAYKKYGVNLKNNGIMIVDSFMVKSFKKDNSFKIYASPFTQIAEEKFNSKILTNMIILGYTTKILNIVSFESLSKALSTIFKGESFEINYEALKTGLHLDVKPL